MSISVCVRACASVCVCDQALGGAAASHKLSPLVVYNDSEYIGGAEDFLAWATSALRYRGKAPNPVLYNQMAKAEYHKFLDASRNTFVFMDVSVAGAAPQRVVFELYDDVCPRTGAWWRVRSSSATVLCVPAAVVLAVAQVGRLVGPCAHAVALSRVQLRTSWRCALERRARRQRERSYTTSAPCSTGSFVVAGSKAAVRAPCSCYPLCRDVS